MLFAELVDVLLDYAPLIGVALAVILVVTIPPLRRGLMQAFEEGKKDGERWKRKRQSDESEE